MPGTRIIVVSDLHLTSGIDPSTGRWSPTEDFFWDDVFDEFLHYVEAGGHTTLVLNGDFIDFLQVVVPPSPTEWISYGLRESDYNPDYGLRCTEASSLFMLDKVVDGHPKLFAGLARFLAAGHEIVVLKGNHDIQFYWPSVQRRLVSRLQGIARPAAASRIPSRIHFKPWFYCVPGLAYVEHGNQYEYTTSFRNFLLPQLPLDYPNTSEQLELDLSAFLVRYWSNRVEQINPLVDNIRPLSEYVRVFWKKHPYTFITTMNTMLKYILLAFSKARALKTGAASRRFREISTENDRRIREEAIALSGKNRKVIDSLYEKLKSIDSRKAPPTLTQSLPRVLWTLLKDPIVGFLWVAPFLVVNLVLNSVVGFPDGILRWLQSGPGQAVLNAVLGLVLILLHSWIRRSGRRRKGYAPGISKELRAHAEYIATTLEVQNVVFGHTHYADRSPLRTGGWYFNSGTWMPIYAPEEEYYRGTRQFSYVDIGEEGATLLRWNPDRRAPEPVVVVETSRPDTDVEDAIVRRSVP